MMSLVNFVPLVKNALEKSNFKELGRLISETWELKKTFSKYISNSEIEKLYHYLQSNGIYGGKVTRRRTIRVFSRFVILKLGKKLLTIFRK